MKKYTTGICAHCGADIGIHKFETENCPVNGKEEARYDRLSGKYFPQQWKETKFEDSGIKKLNDAALELLEELQKVNKYFVDLQNRCVLTPREEKIWKSVSYVIKKATE